MRLAIVCLAAGLGFFVLALFSIELTRSGGRIAAVWLPNAIAVGLLLRFRVQGQGIALIAMAAGNIAANIAAGDAPVQALLLALANTTEIALAVALARRWCEGEPLMEDTSDLTKFVVAAAICGPIASGIIAVIALHQPGLGMLALFAQWVTSDALSMLVLAPSVMIAIDAWRARRRPTRREVTEWTLLTAGGTGATLAVFTQTAYPLLFLIPPVVVAHAFRLGSLGTAFSTIKVAIIALVCTELGLGPINLVAYSTTTQLLVLEAFLASALVVGLPISAILATRERIADKLVRQKAELALLAENLTDAILRVDPQGICTYASPSTTAVLGMPPDEFIGRPIADRLHPETSEAIVEVERRLNSGVALKERLTYRRYLDDESGEAIYIEADCAVAQNVETGEHEGIVVSARDVTARVILERRLKQAMHHAENAARAKAQFLANMSHEIRTPMNGVLGFAELLQRMELGGEAGRYAELIERSGRSMMMLLNDILDISKIESGQLKVTSEPVAIGELAADCVELHLAQAERKGIALTCRIEDDIPPLVASDPLRLRQVLLNLIGNAVKFTESGGIEVVVMREDSRLAISVEDTGIGIDGARLDHIFDPFVQAEGETTRRFGGTGLGLSISRQLAELLGGTLSVDSMPGVGSRFTLRLPVLEVEDRRKASGNRRRAVDRAPPRRGRILLAEDHDINRMLVTAMLEDLGQDVAIAEDGVAAIEMACEAHYAGAPFDLVLMDIQMPGCDGYAATRAIRADGISANALPIVALTANAYPEDVAAAREAGMQAHLAKPLVFEDLAAALARWLPMRIVASDESPMPSPAPSQGATQVRQAELDERWQLRRSEAIEAVSEAIRGGTLDGTAVEELARTVHKLAGTAGMFGEEELGTRAAALERALKSGVTPEVRRKLAEELLQAA
ncbi:MASE1 domain-containing protein [Qipengyuania sp. 6B39]|uniref:ATP-binding protein n=1 Tax=Qipengyuania proteolytica TaxID=2867239 RepID=UPI001C8A6D08|nr:ATP-binding protein [Qipengyuania proteolytica]MBX7497056.1 MASE1 domain-containing protein [Qipengyuania proteolytica]